MLKINENKIIDNFIEKLGDLKPELITIVLKCRCGLTLTSDEFDIILHELDFDYDNILEIKTDHCPRTYGEMITDIVDEHGEPWNESKIYKPRNLELQELLGGHDVRIWNIDYVWFDEFGGYVIYEGI